MIYYKTPEEIELMRISNLLVSQTLAHVGSILKPGVSGADIDREAEAFIRDHGAEPAFKNYEGFPATLCVSVNEAVVHGIPSKEQVFKEGDIVSVDCGVLLNGYYGDSAYTFALGEVDEKVMELLRVTKEAVYLGIEQARVGNRLRDIGYAVQSFAERQHKYGVVRDLVGHGIGKKLHEEPEVPNYGQRGRGIKIQEGLVIAIEPMINLGSKSVRQLKDGWTIVSKDRSPSAHYEQVVAVKKEGPDRLSDFSVIEEVERQNASLREVVRSSMSGVS
ncbi:MAG TPA: type I methionyl aminopeptidase [Phaeodactylibacter sp.]|nr:type I methionyl aminopeptidase [Phaeodactylibacter sp.]